MDAVRQSEFKWLPTGEKALAAMLAAIDGASKSVRLEMYIFRADGTGEQFREALFAACRRGVKTQVLADALGSIGLPESFWQEFRNQGGEFRQFNPITLNRFSIRDHRKILVCDGVVAIVGGFNIGQEYHGDGVKSGWRDLGMSARGPLVGDLAEAFDEMWASADASHAPFARLRRSKRQRHVQAPEASLLLGAPGRANPIKRALRQDLQRAKEARMICPYFLPPSSIWRRLGKIARHGGVAQLILPSKSDVPMSLLAARGFYRRLLTAGVEIYEYEPQVLHAKLYLIDKVVYAGSANLDSRSLNINYELLLRITNPALAREGRAIFDGDLAHCRRIDLETWRRSRTFWDRLKARVANVILARLDPFVAFRQFE